MKTMKTIFAVSFLAALLAVQSLAQNQGPQTLSTTTLSQAIPNVNGGSGITSGVTLASLTNVTATASIQTTLWVDTEAMDVVTNTVPSSGTTVTVTRGTHGTKAEGHASGRTVYVGRPNLFQGYGVAGTCWSNAAGTATLPGILPWIDLTSGLRYNCKSDGNWYKGGSGSAGSAAVTAINGFCTAGTVRNETEYLNGAACSGATTATYSYTVATAGELAELQVQGSAVGVNAQVITVYKNGYATALTCTIAIAAKTCSAKTHGVAVVAGDYIQFQNVVGNTATETTFVNPSATVGLYGQ